MSGDDVVRGDVRSADGTRVGYLRQGRGPGLVLVQGAMGTAYNFADLARALSSTFTVLTPDRRGRGMTPRPYDRGHEIARDVEDVDAVLAETGATRVFGLSSGAVIALEATRRLPRVTRAAVYEPPFYADGICRAGIDRLHHEIETDRPAAALVTALLVAQTAPRPLAALPRPLARLLAAVVLRVDDRRHGSYARLRDLLPGIRYDFSDVASVDGALGTYARVDKPVLLLSGTTSPAFLRDSVRALDEVLPQARHVELDGLDHSGPWNAGRGGRPERVATALRTHLA